MKKEGNREQSNNPDDFQNATFTNTTADLMFCSLLFLHRCLLHCFSVINIIYFCSPQAQVNLVYHFYFKPFLAFLGSLGCLLLELLFG